MIYMENVKDETTISSGADLGFSKGGGTLSAVGARELSRGMIPQKILKILTNLLLISIFQKMNLKASRVESQVTMAICAIRLDF